MKSLTTPILLIVSSLGFAQDINFEAYEQYKNDHSGVTFSALQDEYSVENMYYSSDASNFDPQDAAYYGRFKEKLDVTDNELALLKRNRFMVTERLSYQSYGSAYKKVYESDLPVMVTTDIVLHALHVSYDKMLMHMEYATLLPNLIEFTNKLYDNLPYLKEQYSGNKELSKMVGDVDLFVCVAKSLLDEEQVTSSIVGDEKVKEILDAIAAEQPQSLQLYSDSPRDLEFSMFKPRGHYAGDEDGSTGLEHYFRAMMWYGFIEFMLSNPDPEQFADEDVKRMVIVSAMINELMAHSDALPLIEFNDKLITFFVGPSDNVTPKAFAELLTEAGITSADDLLDESKYDTYLQVLANSPYAQQRILSALIEEDKGPAKYAGYKVLGQRFIFDSFIFTQTSHGNVKRRMMPDPMDAMFVLGNDNVLYLLEDEVGKYGNLGTELAAMRYLADNFSDEYWNSSLYTSWLKAITLLGPNNTHEQMPYFAQTSAWQHEKLNTQMASWAELRHDNLLYAKQSFSGMYGCSFPEYYVEPYPAFYQQLKSFSTDISSFLNENDITLSVGYWNRFSTIMDSLEVLARKEIQQEPFNTQDTTFMSSFLFKVNSNGYWENDINGWIEDLFYTQEAEESDYIIADVHTQPTDEAGNPVGKIMHLATGKINLGVFIAPSTIDYQRQIAYVGAVSSFYKHETENFNRMTDQDWENLVRNGKLPARPDWVNIYLANGKGTKLKAGREIPGDINYTAPINIRNNINEDLLNLQVSVTPNPFTNEIKVDLGEDYRNATIEILSQGGGIVKSLIVTGGSTVIPVSDLSAQSFTLKINVGTSQYTQIIIKQ